MKSLKEVGSFEITKYSFDMVDSEPKIVISMIKVLDQNGKYIKFAKLKEVKKYLCSYPVTFKKLTQCEHIYELYHNENSKGEVDGPNIEVCVKCDHHIYDYSVFK